MQWVIFYNELNRCKITSKLAVISTVLDHSEGDPLVNGLVSATIWIQITLVLVFIISRYWFKSIIRVPP